MADRRDFQEVDIFSIFAGALLLGSDVVAAEAGGDYVVAGPVDEPLAALRDRKFGGIGFAVVIGDFGGRPAKEFDDGIVAEVELVSTLQVDDSGEGYDPSQARFVRGKAKSQLTSCGVSDDDKLLRVETMFTAVLSQKLVGAANVGKSVGPASTFIPDAAIFHVCGRQAFGRESGAQMAGVIQVVPGAPEAPVDIDDCRVWAFRLW